MDTKLERMATGQGQRASGVRPRTVRVALWCAGHGGAVAAGWIGLTVGAFLLSLAIGGIRVAGLEDGVASGTEAARAKAAMAGAATSAGEELDVVVTSAVARATDADFRGAVGEIGAALRATTATIDRKVLPAVSALADPYDAPLSDGYLAPDLTSVRLVGRIEGDAEALAARARAVTATLEALRARLPGYEIHALSPSLLNEGMAQEINRDMDASLLISLPVTLLILLLAFGALVAACIPLVLATTALLAAFAAFGIFSHVAGPVSPYGAEFIVLIGLAVGVDYSLFVLTRFRTERRAGRPRLEAIEAASATSGRAVLLSGLAVTVSLASLLLLPDPMFQSMAIGTIAAIAASMLGSVVFLPALLALVGDRIDAGRIPFLAARSAGGGRIWARVAGAAIRRPVVAAVAATGVIVLLASPIARLRLGESEIAAFPERIDAVAAVAALDGHWPQGSLLTLDVVVTGPDGRSVQDAVVRLEPSLLAVSGLRGPARVTTSADGRAERIALLMAGSANDDANWRIVRDVRERIVPGVLGSGAAMVYVGGDAAASLDQTRIFTDGMARILVFVLGLSFVLLLAVFRSIAIPLKAIVLNLLATGAAFGAMVLVFEDGWFAGALGVRPSGVIQNFVPVFVFTVLFGLSMDYEVFILARIREAIARGASSNEAVAHGIAATAGTVTSAAAIMVVVFAVFLTLPLPIARELGVGMTVAVIVDATLVRTVLLPATMRLLGEWNWWLPGFLGWLPRVAVESLAPDSLAAPLERAPRTEPPSPDADRLLPSGTTVTVR